MLAVVPGHREPRTWGDRIALSLVRTSKWCMDFATGMSRAQKLDERAPTAAATAAKPLTEAQWVCFQLVPWLRQRLKERES